MARGTLNRFERRAVDADPAALGSEDIEMLMLNIGLRCDQACAHCHQSSSPSRTESMSLETMRQAVRLATVLEPRLVDITGGAPEMHAHLRELVTAVRAQGIDVRVRTGLTVLDDDTAAFLAERGVRLLASLPAVTEGEVAAQRGKGAFDRCIERLKHLSSLGYGEGDGLVLEIAHNPPLGELPRAQAELAAEYRAALGPLGVHFDDLLAIANVPVGRLGRRMRADNTRSTYVAALEASFNAATVAPLECRRSVTVAWDGTLWDCDFNLGAELPAKGPVRTLDDALATPDALRTRRIAFADHCFACTANAGSS